MINKEFLQKLDFIPSNGERGIFSKKYSSGYEINVDFRNKKIDFGAKIFSKNKSTQNFSQTENLVVLECVNRLLEKGYQPENIILEKTWPSGHGTSGRLDILVNRADGKSPYLMIECKTWGDEFDKEFRKIKKDGGQLFTYFKQSTEVDFLMLYASRFDGKKIEFRNEIIRIEEDYRQAGEVKDIYDRWNKLTKDNGIFDDWVGIYGFQSKALTPENLRNIKQEDSSFIFNRFLEILRHNVVSDKPNAFNKIFTLFCAKFTTRGKQKMVKN
jgi:type I restriction enzyme M protein